MTNSVQNISKEKVSDPAAKANPGAGEIKNRLGGAKKDHVDHPTTIAAANEKGRKDKQTGQ